MSPRQVKALMVRAYDFCNIRWIDTSVEGIPSIPPNPTALTIGLLPFKVVNLLQEPDDFESISSQTASPLAREESSSWMYLLWADSRIHSKSDTFSTSQDRS